MDILQSGHEGDSNYFINNILYNVSIKKIAYDETFEPNILAWQNIDHSSLYIPSTIWCNLIGKLVTWF